MKAVGHMHMVIYNMSDWVVAFQLFGQKYVLWSTRHLAFIHLAVLCQNTGEEAGQPFLYPRYAPLLFLPTAG